MMNPRVALALSGVPLLLLACAASSTPQRPTAICPQGLSAQSTTAQASRILAASGPVTAPTSPDGMTWASHASADPVNWHAPHVPGRVLVTGDGARGSGVLSALGTQAISAQAVIPGLLLVPTPAGQSDQAWAARLTAQGLSVQPDYLYSALAVPNDPGVPGNAGVNVVTALGTRKVYQTYLTRITAPQAWEFLSACGKTPAAATTAMLDSALESSHPDLQGRIVDSVSFLGATDSRTTEHGTATTGVLAATADNGTGLAGVTWSGSVVSVEVLSAVGASTSVLAKGVNYAVQKGAKVINMSLGTTKVRSDPALDSVLSSAAGSAVLVAAAGNTPGDGVYYPASHPDVIAVGAVGRSNSTLACYSARPSATLTRPLDVVAPGGASYGGCSSAAVTDDLLLLAPGGDYDLQAGTSFSAPLVSGVAGLMRAANPGLSAAQTRALLLESVNRTGGLPLLDAEAAVKAATR